MAFVGFDKKSHDTPLAEINMVPLIDVMLVLLVVFIIAAPLLTHTVKIDLPKVSAATHQLSADTIHLAIDAEGHTFWNDTSVSFEENKERLAASAKKTRCQSCICMWTSRRVTKTWPAYWSKPLRRG